MGDLLGDVDVTIVNNTIYLRGLPAKTLLKDLARIYRYDQHEGEAFFKLIVTGFLIQRATISFNRYFSLEVYSMFARLYNITERGMYKDAVKELVNNDPNLRKYLTPPIPVPAEILDRLKDVNLNLFPYQQEFLNILYNSKYKLGLRGNINSFAPGMGKTASVIACIHALDAVPCIVTAPKSTLDSSWKQSILRFLPKTKPEEVMIIDDYKPTPKWKFLITNYERLAQAYQYASTAAGPVKCLAIDESHNFRYLTTTRSQRLIELVEGLNIETVIPISGTPIKARTSELIPILKILDPTMDDDVVKIFKKMYGGDRYSPIVESVIRKRLSIYIDKEELNESNNSGFPNKEKYNIICTVKNQEAYYISTVKKEMKAYIDSQIPTYAKQQKPNFDKLKELVKSIPDDKYPAEQKFDYVNQVSTKMNAPMSDAGKQAMQLIKQHESALKKAAPDIAKALIITRKMCTSWLQSLLGKAMGIYFVKRRIECSVKMVLDNAKEIGKVIDDGELKTMIFSLYIQPLYSIVDVMKKENINGMVIPGGTDTNALLQQFYNDNTMDFMACTSAIATGTDGIQKACSQLIFCTVPYRAADEDQTIARIYRRGAASKVVKIYYMKLDTPEKNLMDNAYDILEWSAKLFDLAMTLEDENPQGTLKEDYSHITKRIDQCFDMLND